MYCAPFSMSLCRNQGPRFGIVIRVTRSFRFAPQNRYRIAGVLCVAISAWSFAEVSAIFLEYGLAMRNNDGGLSVRGLRRSR